MQKAHDEEIDGDVLSSSQSMFVPRADCAQREVDLAFSRHRHELVSLREMVRRGEAGGGGRKEREGRGKGTGKVETGERSKRRAGRGREWKKMKRKRRGEGEEEGKSQIRDRRGERETTGRRERYRIT